MYFLLKMGIFHCYVSLPEGRCCFFGGGGKTLVEIYHDITHLSEDVELTFSQPLKKQKGLLFTQQPEQLSVPNPPVL